MIPRHSNARVYKCKNVKCYKYCGTISLPGGQLSWICGFLLIPKGSSFVDAPVFSFSNKVNSFLVCFHRRCKLFGEVLPKIIKNLATIKKILQYYTIHYDIITICKLHLSVSKQNIRKCGTSVTSVKREPTTNFY